MKYRAINENKKYNKNKDNIDNKDKKKIKKGMNIKGEGPKKIKRVRHKSKNKSKNKKINNKVENKYSNMRPREKFIMYGGEALNEMELLAIYLQTGSKIKSVNVLALELLEKYGSINRIIEQTMSELKTNDGIGEVKAIKIKALYYMHNMINLQSSKKVKIECAKDIYRYVKQFNNKKEENFYIVALNINNEVIGIRHVFKGTINSVNISLREIFKEALFLDAKNICLVHNHPSGNTYPSIEDIKTTKEIIDFGSILGVKVLDHLVIGYDSFFSLKENEIIDFY